MDLYIYSDESGVFDYVHNDIYAYGGLIFTSKSERDNYNRKYLSAERNISKAYPSGIELKASYISNKHKLKLFKATGECIRFGAVINEKKLIRNIFSDKRSKQRSTISRWTSKGICISKNFLDGALQARKLRKPAAKCGLM